MKPYDHKKIEKKWQKVWDEKKIYKTLDAVKAKLKGMKPYYVLDMFPYPSGAGLHVGHPRGYIASDVFARMKRMQGYNVLHPMGFDSFGLPAEQYAIQTGKNPGPFTNQLVKRYREQLSILGFSYDWDREVATHDPEYYRWTQWIFLQIYNSYYDHEKNRARPIADLIKKFEKTDRNWKHLSDVEKEKILMNYRLAYEGYAEVNWCPELGTVLANDEIIDSDKGPVSERGGFPVEKKKMRQWFMRITAYGDRLIEGLDTVDWPNSIKEIQRNWIGKSEGAEIDFMLTNSSQKITVFTTRPDTLFGVTYVVLAPEHPLVNELKPQIKNWSEVEQYVAASARKDEMTRVANDKDKTGVQLNGVFAVNPANGEEVPVWVADYVLSNYGTGAVMAVPAHDERDFEFAKKHKLPIKKVVCMETGVFHPSEERRDGGGGIVFDPKTQKYAMAKWHSDGRFLPFAGGVDAGEDIQEGSLREVKEESGLSKFVHVEKIETIFAHYFNKSKQVHRVTSATTYLCVTDGSLSGEHHRESHEQFDVVWVPAQEVLGYWNSVNQNGDYTHSMRFLVESVARAIELGYDRTSDPKVFKATPITEYGILADSGKFTDLTSAEAKKKITNFVGGRWVTKYKFRDAIFARQRYWGEPIPLIHKKDGTIDQVPEKDLPLELPKVKSYAPAGDGQSPLATVTSWVKAGYETNTMPGWAGSSWYFLRYADPKNKKAFASEAEMDYWFGRNGGVQMYVGGAEHATGHLLYSRFWHKVLKDLGYVQTEEPFKALRNQGLIGGTDGRKMSKRWGNVINPDDVVRDLGADTIRVYEAFMGPFESSLPWSTDGIVGSRRFIERVWKSVEKVHHTRPSGTISKREGSSQGLQKILHKTIKKVTDDIAAFGFNTAVSSMMIFLNALEKSESISTDDLKKFLQILAPFAPHVAEELWNTLGEKKSIHLSQWPTYDAKLIVDDEVTIGIQINGKVRAQISLAKDAPEASVREQVLAMPDVQKWVGDQPVKKFIVVPNKIISIVI